MTAGSSRVMTATASHDSSAERRDGVSWTRLLWVAPLTVVVALLVNLAIKTVLQALNPALAEMGQLGRPMIILTLEGAILAVLVFAVMVWLVPHPIRWFRIVAVIALLISLIPDLLLGFGGDLRRSRLGHGLALHPLRGPVLSRTARGRTTERRAISRGGAAGAALGPGADPDAAARGHRRGLHRAADDADPGAGHSTTAWYALFRPSPIPVKGRQECPGAPGSISPHGRARRPGSPGGVPTVVTRSGVTGVRGGLDLVAQTPVHDDGALVP